MAIPRPAATLFLAASVMFFMNPADLFGQSTYQKPPKIVTDILESAPPPSLSLSPTRDRVALVHNSRFPSIADLAEPMLRLAGLRINPKTNGPARQPRVVGISFMPVQGGPEVAVKIPDGAKFSAPQWSPDGKRFAVTNTTADGIELWIGDSATAQLQKVDGIQLNAVIGDPIDWIDATHLLVQATAANRGKPPEQPLAPVGPTVQQSSGKAAPVRTYQDMLQNGHDEALFEYYGTSQLVTVNAVTREVAKVGTPGIISGSSISPDGQYILVVRLKKPFSYLHPYSAFPKLIEVWNMQGQAVHTVADLPLQDKVPIEGVPTGPRSVRWIPTAAATLLWVEALDGGDPKVKVPHRDEVEMLAAPFNAGKKAAYQTEHRYSGTSFFEDGDVLITDFDRERRWTRTVKWNFTKPPETALVVFDRSSQDRYNDPGTPLTKPLANGQRVLHTLGKGLLLSGAGATPKGEFPFLAVYDIEQKKSNRLFTCPDGQYETLAAVIDAEKRQFLIRRESPTEPGNYYFRNGDTEVSLTKNTDPFPELRKVKKQLVTCQRDDGVTISFTLYLPPDYKEGEKLPTIFWAYPREFNTADTASQVSGSPNRFVTLSGYSHLFFLTQGYAVMDEVSMPIIGPPDKANDTFVEQLQMSARAAIDKAVQMGAVDRTRIGIGGHSYGAFMTANLLAHSDYFRAGIARSGAYNRTLTPFGFQNERRTFWEAPDVYAKMSPFHNAQKIDEPLLMIHGQADSNPGTFPVQSERLYQAIRGNGGTARLVLLPHEDHGYAAKESIQHVLAEQLAWFDRYVKNAKPREPKGTGEK